ncbi:MAG: sialate O-acetylesterase [Phycisphaerales bacterium]|nr:sialate O-acetylesterase [Phycisphaerales bacterium]
MPMIRLLALSCLIVPIALFSAAEASSKEGVVKVFLLAGQSNMEGKGAVNTLAWLGEDEQHGHLLKTIQNEDGEWREGDDVWIDYLGRRGKLGVGYGSKGGPHGPRIGPEYGFGMVVGQQFDEPVLLVKAAWGGKDVANDFRAPGSEGPGEFYTKTVKHLESVLANMDEHFPALAGRTPEIAGIVWFQGWNDMVNAEKREAYTENLAQMLRDLRRDIGCPDCPVVIGELGAGGDKPSKNVAKFREAQAAVAKMPEFNGQVRFVETAKFWDPIAQEMYDEDVWKGEDKARFYRIASDRPYHYLGSGKIYFLMGHAFGTEMVEATTK